MNVNNDFDKTMAADIEARYQQARALCASFVLKLPHTYESLFRQKLQGSRPQSIVYYKTVQVEFVKPTLRERLQDAYDIANRDVQTCNTGGSDYLCSLGKRAGLRIALDLLAQEGL